MIYLDMDGVQADFNAGFRQLYGMEPEIFEKRFGAQAFWALIETTKGFYANLPQMIDVGFLWDHIGKYAHATLTALPRTFTEKAELEKKYWLKSNVPNMSVYTVVGAKNKVAFADTNDILIDDRIGIKDSWEKAGGIFIHHTSAYNTLKELRGLGI